MSVIPPEKAFDYDQEFGEYLVEPSPRAPRGALARRLWAEFIDLTAYTPLPPGTSDNELLLRIGVLLLRSVLLALVLSPAGWALALWLWG